ncbi:MAG: DUF559 domain-containing protein, partial [Patescibacteria group bacterium]
MADELNLAQVANETADYRIVGLTIETRPDWIKTKEVIHLRKLGVTRVELGLQIINDRVLSLTKRGTTVADAEQAIALCKTAGLKVDVHIMPGQPGASIEDDLESFKLLFGDPRFRPDMVKIYPCVVLPDAELAEWSARGEFKPLEGQDLLELLIKMQTMVPRYCRIPRVIRDFPTTGILQGNKQSNLREMMDSEMTRRGLKCVCLRCREVGHVAGDHTHDKTQLFEERYENAGGTEVFLSIENKDRSAVFGFCRLRLPDKNPPAPFIEGVLANFPERRQYIPYNQSLALKAREYRNNPTIAERKMWDDILRRDTTGCRFLRQKPLDHYIADFYCPELLLVVEIDGPSHGESKEHDQIRTEQLEKYGITVVRFLNYDVMNCIDSVKQKLQEIIKKRREEIHKK